MQSDKQTYDVVGRLTNQQVNISLINKINTNERVVGRETQLRRAPSSNQPADRHK